MEQQRHRACERMKSNTKSRPIQIDLAQNVMVLLKDGFIV